MKLRCFWPRSPVLHPVASLHTEHTESMFYANAFTPRARTKDRLKRLDSYARILLSLNCSVFFNWNTVLCFYRNSWFNNSKDFNIFLPSFPSTEALRCVMLEGSVFECWLGEEPFESAGWPQERLYCLAWGPGFHSWDPQGRRESSPESCSLVFMRGPHHVAGSLPQEKQV